MERFLSLPLEKQNVIIDAAMSLFGAVGYKKASVADIAEASGISKAMVFYYFGSKKALYLYLIEFAGKTLKAEIDNRFDKTVTDFFERIRLTAEIKMSVMKRFPGILSFLTGMYYETDKGVTGEINQVLSEGEAFGSAFVFENMQAKKFKDDVSPELVMKILTCYSEGYMSGYAMRQYTDFDALMADFNKCLDLMKRHFYKEEYVKEQG